MLIQIFEIVAPVFALAAIGFFWARAGAPFDIPFVTRLCMTVSGPCLIFSTLVQVRIEPEAFQNLAGATAALYALLVVGLAALLWIARLPMRAYLAPLVFGNTGNIGLPICLFAYGDTGLALAIIVFAVMAALSFTIGVWLVSGDASPAEAMRQPIFYGAAFGAAGSYLGWSPPGVVLDTLQLVGQILIPMMLITLGVSIARLAASNIALALLLSLAKVGLSVLAGLLAADLFGLEGETRGVLVLQAVMPVAVTSYLLAERYAASPKEVAGLVVTSTLISIAVLPLTLAALI